MLQLQPPSHKKSMWSFIFKFKAKPFIDKRINCYFHSSGSWGVIFVLLQKEYFQNSRILFIYDSKLRKPRKYRIILYSIYRLFIKSCVFTHITFSSEIQIEKAHHNWQPGNLFKIFSWWSKVLLPMNSLHEFLNSFYKADIINALWETVGTYTSPMGSFNTRDGYDVGDMTKTLIMLLGD